MKFIIKSGLLFCFLIVMVTADLDAGQNQPTEAQQAATKGMKLDTGREIYEAACIGCHGPGGRGQPPTTLGFEKPDTFPDFSDCNGSTRESTYDWRATIHEGGAHRGFSEIMPSWADALTTEQIKKVAQYLRSLCTESGWPFGELNFPRAIMTEKAFPEDEWTLTGAVTTRKPRSDSGELIYEKRLGAKSQIELAAPYAFLQGTNRGWVGGIGDLSAGLKRVLLYNNDTGSILSAQGGIAIPTGNKTKDLGSGTTSFEAFAAFGQRLPRLSFLQVQGGAELPTDTSREPRTSFLRMALGKTIAQNSGYGRAWTPIVEFLGGRDLVSGAETNWDIVPEIQVTLNKRQHIRAGIGVQKPITNTAGRSAAGVFYLLWDWFDGGLKAGW